MTSVETQTTTDNEKTRYIKALPYSNCCAYSGFVIIDLEFLKNCDLLEGATIFKKLFGLVENDETFCYDLNINEKFETTILQDFRITKDDWKNFMFFLRQHSVPESSLIVDYIIDNDKRTSVMGRVLSKLESVMETCITFGGVPKFEEYYNNYFKKINSRLCAKKYCEYNPGNPREDKLNRYIWASHNSLDVNYLTFLNSHKISNGWSAASSMSSSFVWYRKLKNGDESDIDAVYTNSDVEEATEPIEEQMEADSDDENNNIQYDFDHQENALEPWLDNDAQETPYNGGW